MLQRGFTLIEIAIVLLIVSIILGYTVAMFPVQQEIKQYKQANREMDEILNSLYAFAQVNGYLPCPANYNAASSGFECRDDADDPSADDGNCDGGLPAEPAKDSCDIWFGYVPGKTLGLNGKYSSNGLLLDPWGEPYRYHVSDDDDDGDGKEDFIIQAEMKDVGMNSLKPDLAVCNSLVGITSSACGNASRVVISNVPAVILSTGKDLGRVGSAVQIENLDNSKTDKVFISVPRNSASGAEYDDLVKWISPNVLYSKMVETRQFE